MASGTKKKAKAQQKAQHDANARYKAFMKKMRVTITLRMGVMNFMASQEVLDMLDLFDEDEIPENLKIDFQTLEAESSLVTAVIREYYRDQDAQYAYFNDICNVAYAEVKGYIDKLKECVIAMYEKLGTADAERKAQINMATMMLQLTDKVFKDIRKYNLVKHKVDIYPQFAVFGVTKSLSSIDNIIHEFAQIPEVEESINFWDVEGVKETFEEFTEVVAGNDFIDKMCKKAIVLNKDRLPELYEAMRGKDSENE